MASTPSDESKPFKPSVSVKDFVKAFETKAYPSDNKKKNGRIIKVEKIASDDAKSANKLSETGDRMKTTENSHRHAFINEKLTEANINISDETKSENKITSDLVEPIDKSRRHALNSSVLIENGRDAIANSRDTSDRVKSLESQLRKTLDRSFSPRPSTFNSTDSSSPSEVESGVESNDEITTKFATYVRRVRQRLISENKKELDHYRHLFCCCFLVGLNRCTPYIKKKFPENVKIPYKIEELCFPDVQNAPMDRSDSAQCYSLVITNESGERTFGYCRRVLPEGSNVCLPLVYCILSRHRAPGFYRKVLQEVETRHGLPDKLKDILLAELYHSRFPKPGENVTIDCSKIIAEYSGTLLDTNDGVNYNKDRTKYSSALEASSSKFFCDNKPVSDDSNKEHELLDSVNSITSGSSVLDLTSYVVVNNNGEYGTIKISNKEEHSDLNVTDTRRRGSSAGFLTIPRTLPDGELRKSASSPSVLSDELEVLPSELVLMRPFDSRHEENDLRMLCDTVASPILQQIFGSLLLERKVILVSCILSKVSSCIEALQIILYPFSWPHTFIPVLPQSLWEILEAPTPLVCGVLSMEVVNQYKIEYGLVVDLDQGAILLREGDEDKVLPHCMIMTWKDGLSLAESIPSKGSDHIVLLSDSFLRVFIQSCGHYKNHIVDGHFQKAAFIEYGKQKGRGIRRFLRWFTETSMFDTFINTALNNPDSFGIFDKRVEIYSSDTAPSILKKMKFFSRKT